jgi:hypothetical protein
MNEPWLRVAFNLVSKTGIIFSILKKINTIYLKYENDSK